MKITCPKFYSNLPGANELTNQKSDMGCKEEGVLKKIPKTYLSFFTASLLYIKIYWNYWGSNNTVDILLTFIVKIDSFWFNFVLNKWQAIISIIRA